jgi:hypothetical protein
MNLVEIHLPDPCGETVRFAGEEPKNFLHRCHLPADVTAEFELDPALKCDEFQLAGHGRYGIKGGSETAMLYGAYELLKQLGFRL